MGGLNWKRVNYEAKARRYGTEGVKPSGKSPEAARGLKKPRPGKPDAKKPQGDRLKLAADRQRAIEKLRALRAQHTETWDALGL